jgi:hypothetical protein
MILYGRFISRIAAALMRKVGKADIALALYGWCDDQVDMIDVAQVLGSPSSDGSFGTLRSKSRPSKIVPRLPSALGWLLSVRS